MRATLPRLRRALGAWCALFALWWLFVGAWSGWNLVWGAVIATVATVTALLSAPTTAASFAGARRLRDVAAAARQVVLDFGVITVVLARALATRDRGPHGSFVARRTDLGDGHPGAGAERAWRSLMATYSPNAYVVEVEPRTGTALLHDLKVWRPSEEPL